MSDALAAGVPLISRLGRPLLPDITHLNDETWSPT